MRKMNVGIIWFLTVFIIFGIAQAAEVTKKTATKKYCVLGTDPVDSNYKLAPDEEIEVSKTDILVRMKGGSGRVSECWVKAGTEFVVSRNDKKRKALKLNVCANPILNDIFFPREEKRADAWRQPVLKTEPEEGFRETVTADAKPEVSEVKPEIIPERRSVISPCTRETRVTESFFGGHRVSGIEGTSGAGIISGLVPGLSVTQTTTVCNN